MNTEHNELADPYDVHDALTGRRIRNAKIHQHATYSAQIEIAGIELKFRNSIILIEAVPGYIPDSDPPLLQIREIRKSKKGKKKRAA